MIMKIVQSFVLVMGMTLPSGAWAATYYINWENGSDINDGVTKNTPWKRAPGMRGCSGECKAYQTAHQSPTSTSGAGDRFIFKGGVTWPNEVFSWDWIFGSGTAADPIYFGVDMTWHTGSSWSRPIMDLQSLPTTPSTDTSTQARFYGNRYIVDNFEFTGRKQISGTAGGSCATYSILAFTYPGSGSEVKNNYFHGWSHAPPATGDCMNVLQTPLITEGPDMDFKIHNNVWDGSDTTKDMAMAYKGSAGHFYNNYISGVTNGIVANGGRYYWGNTFKDIGVSVGGTPACPDYFSFDCTSHGNSIESMSTQSIIYNNLFYNLGGGVTIWTQPKSTQTDYIFNNVVISDRNQGVQVSNESLLEWNVAGVYIFNNTFQGLKTTSNRRISGPAFTAKPIMSFMTVWNNLMISENYDISFSRVGVRTEVKNVGMTNAEAESAQYIVKGTCPLSHTTQGVTVGVGKDLRSFAVEIPSTAVSNAANAALFEASCGVEYNAIEHRVVGPNIQPTLRGGKWDIGAYQQATYLLPPVNLLISQ